MARTDNHKRGSDNLENKAIIHIAKYPLKKSDFKSIHPDIIAAYTITCHAESEVNTLMKLSISASSIPEESNAIQTMGLIHHSIIMRIWSAKLFEFWDFMKLSAKYNRTKNSDLVAFCNSMTSEFDNSKDRPGYKTACNLRNETTNHYSLSAARTNFKHTHESLDLSMYLHRSSGNSLYALGENVMSTSSVIRQAGQNNMEGFREIIDDWFEWNREVTELLKKTNYRIFTDLILPHIPAKKIRETPHYVPYSLVIEHDEPTTPLFMRFSNKEKPLPNE